MNVMVNGEARELAANASIQDLLDALGFDGASLVVQKNDDIIEQADYAGTPLNDADQIELVRFVGGG